MLLQVVDKVLKLTEMLQEADTHSIESVLLYGPRGSGKSGLVGHIASLLKFALVKVTSHSIFTNDQLMKFLVQHFETKVKVD